VGKVKLAYLDPPFNTQQAFEHYDDALEHSVWLTMMRDGLLQIRKLLSPDGPVWVHCDDSEQAYLKVMMDEVFGRSNFIATVIWEKTFSIKSSAAPSLDRPGLRRDLRAQRRHLASDVAAAYRGSRCSIGES
jgi:adenine-specific DNA-methyltransferase